MEREFSRLTRRELWKCFGNQLKRLRDRKCPQPVIDFLEKRRIELVTSWEKKEFFKNCVPFLFVVPPPYIGIYHLLEMLRYQDNKGFTRLEPWAIGDSIDAPQKPYCIFNVEDGEATRGLSFYSVEELVKKQIGRRGLTARETAHLALQTDILTKHNLNSTSLYFEDLRIHLSIYRDGPYPYLDWCYPDSGHQDWGLPTCDEEVLIL